MIKDRDLGLIFLDCSNDSAFHLVQVKFSQFNVSDDEALDAHHLMAVIKVWDTKQIYKTTPFLVYFCYLYYK